MIKLFKKLICKFKGHKPTFNPNPFKDELVCKRCGKELKTEVWIYD